MDSSCPAPFLDESLFPSTGGALLLRYCLSQFEGNASCCLPCPSSAWSLPHAYYLVDQRNAAAWPSLGSLILMAFLFITFIVLPTDVTERHYLTTVPMIGFSLILISFVIPIRSTPNECYDPITPNDNTSDLTCGAMAVTLFLGCWIVLISCFFRALSLHILVCWEVRPGRKFFIISMLTTFLGAGALLAVCLLVSGAAYQYGKICYLLPHYSQASLWGPVLGVTIASLVVQVWTMGYCIKIIVQPLIDDWRMVHCPVDGGNNSIDQRVISARHASLRIKMILSMQWRPTLIVTLILGYVVFLADVLMQVKPLSDYPAGLVQTWFACLAETSGDIYKCHAIIAQVRPRQPELLAVLFMFIFSGALGMIIASRWTMIRGWRDFLRSKNTLIRRSVQRVPLPRQPDEEEIEISRMRACSQQYSATDSEATWSRHSKQMTYHSP